MHSFYFVSDDLFNITLSPSIAFVVESYKLIFHCNVLEIENGEIDMDGLSVVYEWLQDEKSFYITKDDKTMGESNGWVNGKDVSSEDNWRRVVFIFILVVF